MKKTNRYLILIGVVFMMGMAWYMLFRTTWERSRDYSQALEEARRLSDLKIYRDAESYYFEAYEIAPSYELGLEIARFYNTSGDEDAFEEFADRVLSQYPDNPELYEIMLNHYMEQAEYEACVDLVQRLQGQEIHSEKIEACISQLKTKYEIQYTHYNSITKFSNGYCAVMSENGQWGYINEEGKGRISCSYQTATAFTEDGLAAIKDENGECCIVNTEGDRKEADMAQRAIEDCQALSEGRMAIRLGGQYTFVKKDYSDAFGQYEAAGNFSNGIAPVRSQGKWNLINTKGEKVTEDIYEDVKMDELKIAFRQDRAFVKKGGGYILIDTKGGQIGDTAYEDACPFNEEGYAAVKVSGKWTFINTKGEIVIKRQFDEARSFSHSYAAVKNGGKWGYINENGEFFLECQFQGASDFSGKKSCFVQIDDKWSLIEFYL